MADNIAHDLRTPLTKLRNALEEANRLPDRDEGRERIAAAIADADRLLRTFGALLRISRIESGEYRVPGTPVSMSGVVGDAIDLYEALAEERAGLKERQQKVSASIKESEKNAKELQALLDEQDEALRADKERLAAVDAELDKVTVQLRDAKDHRKASERERKAESASRRSSASSPACAAASSTCASRRRSGTTWR